METLVLTVHVIACLFLIVVVLLQTGQEGMGVIFGGSSGSMFGSSGAGGLLVKVTTALAVIFLVTSLAYNLLAGKPRVHGDSIMLNAKEVEETLPEPVKQPPAGVTFEESQQPPVEAPAAPATK